MRVDARKFALQKVPVVTFWVQKVAEGSLFLDTYVTRFFFYFILLILSQVVRENWELLPPLTSLDLGYTSEAEGREAELKKKKEVYASLRNALVDCLETSWEMKSWSWAKVRETKYATRGITLRSGFRLLFTFKISLRSSLLSL